MVRQGLLRLGWARFGRLRLGSAWLGMGTNGSSAKYRTAVRCGRPGLGQAGCGAARRGSVGQGHQRCNILRKGISMSYRVQFELVGEMPLLMHWDNIEGGDLLKEWRQDGKNKNQSIPGDDRSPPWTWKTYLYTDGEHVTIPQDNLMAALMAGATQVILKRQKTYKELSQSAILIASEHLHFEYADGKRLLMSVVDKMKDDPFTKQAEKCKALGFRLFCKRAKIGQAKHVRVRPRFDTWKVRGELQVLSDDLPFEKLELIFNYAGRAGLCDWRPNSPKRPGPYGMFSSKLKRAA